LEWKHDITYQQLCDHIEENRYVCHHCDNILKSREKLERHFQKRYKQGIKVLSILRIMYLINLTTFLQASNVEDCTREISMPISFANIVEKY
jgi:hypothetical protein